MKELIKKLEENINDYGLDMGTGWDNLNSIKEALSTLKELEQAINYTHSCEKLNGK